MVHCCFFAALIGRWRSAAFDMNAGGSEVARRRWTLTPVLGAGDRSTRRGPTEAETSAAAAPSGRQVGGGRVRGHDADGDGAGGRQDGKRADDGQGFGLAAGFGVPLVAMVCHSADPLLSGTQSCAGRMSVAPGRRDSPINHIGEGSSQSLTGGSEWPSVTRHGAAERGTSLSSESIV